jgi:hypothetical protein
MKTWAAGQGKVVPLLDAARCHEECDIESLTFHPLPPMTHLLTAQDKGCAIAQAVSRRLPTAAARVRAEVKSCWICGGQSGTGGLEN